MALFDPAFDKMIRNEGGFKLTHIEGDRGGQTYAGDLLGVIYHKQCRDCGQFLPRDRWVRTDDPYKAHGLCRDCGIMYDDPALM